MIFSAQQRKEFAESIKPSVKGQSDKFSWRLYQRALKKGRERVYLMAWSSLDGRHEPNMEDLKTGFVSANRLAMGWKEEGSDWFHGATLRQICTPGSPKHDWSYSPAHHVADWIDVTEWFWSSYENIGRCLFFKSEHSWVNINRNAKKCAYCGKHIRREVKKMQTTKRVEVWS